MRAREREVVEVLRSCILNGSDRDLPVDQPLGHLGLGLDSLAVVEFVTALEKRYRVVFPDSLWTDRGQFTIRGLADVIEARVPGGGHRSRRRSLPSRWRHSAANAPYRQLLRERIQKQGVIRILSLAPSQLLSRLTRLCYSRSRFVLLVRDLDTLRARNHLSTPSLVLREMSEADAPALRSLWPSRSSSRM